MLKRRKVSHPGASMEGKTMYFASVEPRGADNAYYQSIYANYRMETPDRKQVRKGRVGSKFMRVRLVFPRVRIRFLSPIQLFEKMRDSYCRLVFAQRRPDHAAVSTLYQYDYSQASYSSNDIADCIEFIKRNAATHEAASALLRKAGSRRGQPVFG